MADRQLTFDLLARDRASQALKRVGDAAEDMGDEFRQAAQDADKLDREINNAQRSLRDLAREFARTDDAARRMDLSKSMRKQQAEIRKLSKARDLLGGDGDGAAMGARLGVSTAGGFFAAFSTSMKGGSGLGPALAGVAAIAAPSAVLAGTVLGAAMSGAMVAAVGGGALAGGIALALRDSGVKSQVVRFGRELLSELESAARVFHQPISDAMSTLRGTVRQVMPDIQAMFASSARFLDPLVKGFSGFVRGALPGMRQALAGAMPLFQAIGQGLTSIGKAVGDVFRSLSDNGAEMATGLTVVFGGIAAAIRMVGGALNGLTEAFGAIMPRLLSFFEFVGKAGAVMSVLPGPMGAVGRKLMEVGDTATTARGQWEAYAASARAGGGASSTAADQVRGLTESLKAAAAATLAASNSEIAFEQAIDDAAAAVAENGRTLDVNTAKGRANRTALNNLAAAATQAAADILAETNSQRAANEVADRGRAKFLALADKMGMSAREARTLADRLFGIPNVNRTVRVGTDAAKGAVRDFMALYSQVRNRSVTISGYVRWSSSGLKVPGGTILQRHGGVTEYARDGLVRLNKASTFTPMAPARYGFAEPATGGEAFIPKRGDAARSKAILAKAASWYGMSVVGGRGGGGGGSVPAVATGGGGTMVNITVMVAPTANKAEVGREVAGALDAYYKRGGRRP